MEAQLLLLTSPVMMAGRVLDLCWYVRLAPIFGILAALTASWAQERHRVILSLPLALSQPCSSGSHRAASSRLKFATPVVVLSRVLILWVTALLRGLPTRPVGPQQFEI